jgi:hypothetical protein
VIGSNSLTSRWAVVSFIGTNKNQKRSDPDDAMQCSI